MGSDPERISRFQREARTLAALNHPHIAAIHGLEETSGTPVLVMELVEGEDLARRLARGAIPVADALAVAAQIADALDAAHERGIVHRDLKPANIKLRDDDTVKVLDFGLAKMFDDERGGPRPADAATITSPVTITSGGMVLGTAAYMSPEQARGHPVDARTDLWAFGCVLFEMLTGTRAFPGDTVTDILAAVVKEEPRWHDPAGGNARGDTETAAPLSDQGPQAAPGIRCRCQARHRGGSGSRPHGSDVNRAEHV